MKSLIPIDSIERRIYLLRGHKVMLAHDLAELYGVSTKRLNEQVKRNLKRFPGDFMFQLNKKETENWRSQFATSIQWVRMGLRRSPYAFTEHGAVMLATILNSRAAVDASIQVVRAFIRLREMVLANKELAVKLAELESKVSSHDEHIQSLFEAIHRLMEPPEKPRPQIGFRPHNK